MGKMSVRQRVQGLGKHQLSNPATSFWHPPRRYHRDICVHVFRAAHVRVQITGFLVSCVSGQVMDVKRGKNLGPVLVLDCGDGRGSDMYTAYPAPNSSYFAAKGATMT